MVDGKCRSALSVRALCCLSCPGHFGRMGYLPNLTAFQSLQAFPSKTTSRSVQFAFDKWQTNRRWLAAALFILALAFVANVFYVATSRTFLVVIPVLLVVFGYQAFGWKGAVSLVVGIFVLAMAAWPSASFLR